MTHIQWEWARGELTLKPLDAATSALQDFNRWNIFWEKFVVQTDFAKFAKDNFTSKEIEDNLNLTWATRRQDRECELGDQCLEQHSQSEVGCGCGCQSSESIQPLGLRGCLHVDTAVVGVAVCVSALGAQPVCNNISLGK